MALKRNASRVANFFVTDNEALIISATNIIEFFKYSLRVW